MKPSGAARSSGLSTATYRGLSLDVGRKAFSVEAIERLLHRIAELGFTALKLHLTETHRVGVQLPGFEHLAAADAWTVDDARRIAETAARVGLALIPEVDLPSHAGALLAGREHLQLTDRHGTVHPDRLDVSHPEALEFALSLTEAAAALFPGDAVHLGGDEFFAAPWEDEDAQRSDRFPSLVEHARGEAGPNATALDSYALFINALAVRVMDLGRTPILWNDHVVPASQNPHVPISNDIVIDVWIRWRDWTPSVIDYLDSGYRVINSHGDLLYFVLSDNGIPAPRGERRFGLLEDTFAPRRFMGLAAQDRHIDVAPVPVGGPDPVLGASLSVWCDSPDALTEQETLDLLDTWLVPFAVVMGSS